MFISENYSPASSPNSFRSGIDNPIGMLRDHDGDGEFSENEVFIFTKDHLNSVRDLTNMNQRLVQRYNYSAYGKVKLERIADASDVRFVENYFTYTAREWEPEVGFICHRARCQEGNGRWISEDQKFIEGGVNRYSYSENQPTVMVDPYGESALAFAVVYGLLIPEKINPDPSPEEFDKISKEYSEKLPAALRFQRKDEEFKIRKYEREMEKKLNLKAGKCGLG